jgi:hypothetical protein
MTALASWRDHILKDFTPQVSRLTLVADPDGLLLEEGVLEGIHARGFDLIPFEDPVAFRYAYESKYRERWDRGEQMDLVVVLRVPRHDLRCLPFDLLQAGRTLSFSLAELFPNLSAPVVDALDRSHFEALWRAQAQHLRDRLGDNATKDFLLQHVFEIVPEQITESVGLLRILLRRHYLNSLIPQLLDERLIQVLRQQAQFAEWPLEEIVPDRKAFFGFLQERWPVFLESLPPDSDEAVHLSRTGYGLQFKGPAELPFNDQDIRVYVDNLFLEGHLHPVSHHRADRLAKTWACVGLRLAPHADRLHRLQGLLSLVEGAIPGPEARHGDWLRFAFQWAELWALRYADNHGIEPALAERLEQVRGRLDEAFGAWVGTRYSGLHNQPAMPPVMLHHVGRHLARRLAEDSGAKVALIVMDGLSLDQWVAVREELGSSPNLRLDLEEAAVFAWVPTLTAVSRQSIFAGRLPLFFGGHLFSTDKEAELWRQFWAEQGLQANQAGYIKGLRGGSLAAVEDLIVDTRIRAVGLVVDAVDRIMHGMQLGTAGMHNQVRQWVREGYFAGLVEKLSTKGYDVYLTSDHGNIEATGIGRPTEGAMAEERGERARIYPTDLLRRKVKAQFPDTIEWPTLGLPDDFRPLLAQGRGAFVGRGTRLVGHGGASLEEVIVPFVKLRIGHD